MDKNQYSELDVLTQDKSYMTPKQIPNPLPAHWLYDVVNLWRETGGERMLHLASQLETIIDTGPCERPTKTHNLITGKPARNQLCGKYLTYS